MAVTAQRFTFDEWVDSPFNTARGELVDGIPVERMTTSGHHGLVVKRLERWLDQAEAAGYGQRFSGPTGVLLDATSTRANVREPDVYFFRQDQPILLPSKGIEGLPDLVIEVLSPGNRSDDLTGGSVWETYERFAVPAYWIVDIDARTVTQYVHRNGRFREVAVRYPGEGLQSSLFPGAILSVDSLFQGLD